MFSSERNEPYVLPSYYGNEDVHNDAQEAAEREFVEIDAQIVSANWSHPVVAAAEARLSALRTFMSNASPELAQKYEEEHGHPFSIQNRDFWEEKLGL